MGFSFDRNHDWTQYPYEVSLGVALNEERREEMRAWIKENIPGRTVFERPHNANAWQHTVCFREEKHAVMFKLRWL